MYSMPSPEMLDVSATLVFIGFGLLVIYLVFNIFF
jgi:hypothetical protein